MDLLSTPYLTYSLKHFGFSQKCVVLMAEHLQMLHQSRFLGVDIKGMRPGMLLPASVLLLQDVKLNLTFYANCPCPLCCPLEAEHIMIRCH